MECGKCMKGRPHGREEIWCRLFGIMIHKNHTGCKYFGGKSDDDGGKKENAG